uniref:Uncharacterized protein n=1 Tax=Nelumbo nucifera TaxID=4432 RepID=A0A822YX33_NELNU|nr:TPA_asm: hypothetical protein HUJ06_007738 [Nelumbo nucifera]
MDDHESSRMFPEVLFMRDLGSGRVESLGGRGSRGWKRRSTELTRDDIMRVADNLDSRVDRLKKESAKLDELVGLETKLNMTISKLDPRDSYMGYLDYSILGGSLVFGLEKLVQGLVILRIRIQICVCGITFLLMVDKDVFMLFIV